jgi:hypothetical protein
MGMNDTSSFTAVLSQINFCVEFLKPRKNWLSRYGDIEESLAGEGNIIAVSGIRCQKKNRCRGCDPEIDAHPSHAVPAGRRYFELM